MTLKCFDSILASATVRLPNPICVALGGETDPYTAGWFGDFGLPTKGIFVFGK